MSRLRFGNLHPGKRKRLLGTFLSVLSGKSWRAFRITAFIREAGISRAGFYNYFEGKEDLALCMLEEMCREFKMLLTDCFRQKNGHFLYAMLQTLRTLVSSGDRYQRYHVYRVLLQDTEMRESVLRLISEAFCDQELAELSKRCMQADRPGGCDQKKVLFAKTLELGIAVIMETAVRSACGQTDTEVLMEAAEKELEILDRGLCICENSFE